MKKALVIITLFLCEFYTLKAGNLPYAGEVYFSQDSFQSNKFHFTINTISAYFGYTDSIYVAWDDGPGSSIPVTGLIPYPHDSNLYVKTYSGVHTFPLNYMDSIVGVASATGPHFVGITNTTLTGFYLQVLPLVVLAVINLKALKNTFGYKSPHFQASAYIKDTLSGPLSYDPSFVRYNNDNTIIKLTNPVEGYGGLMPGYISPPDYNPPSNLPQGFVYTCDSSTGSIYWNHPVYSGFYDVAYNISDYRHDTFVSSVTREMIFLLITTGADTQTTSINPTQNINPFHCYPSPTSRNFTIDMTGYEMGEKQVDIYNQLGQVIDQIRTSEDQLQLNKLPSGIYTIVVTQGTQRACTRMIVE